MVTEPDGAVLEVTGRDGDWYRIALSPDMVADPAAPRTVYVLARLVSSAMGSSSSPQGVPASGLMARSSPTPLVQPSSAPTSPSVSVVDAATPLRTGPGVTYPIVIAEAAGAVLDVTGHDGDWYRIALGPDMVADPERTQNALCPGPFGFFGDGVSHHAARSPDFRAHGSVLTTAARRTAQCTNEPKRAGT